MINKIKFTFFFLFIVSLTFAQKTICGKIINSETKGVVDIAQISVKNSSKGVYSNIDGVFKIANINSVDTLVITHISFEKKYISLNQFPTDGVISLIPKVNLLNEVCIKSTSLKEYKLIPRRRLLLNSSYSGMSGDEVATLVSDSHLEGAYLSSIVILTRKILVDHYYIRVHLYNNKNGMPGKEIVLKDNLYEFIKGSSKSIIDIYESRIVFPKEGLFVSMEYIGKFEKGSFIKDDDMNKGLRPYIITRAIKDGEQAYIRIWDNKWHILEDLMGGSYKQHKYLIGLTVVM